MTPNVRRAGLVSLLLVALAPASLVQAQGVEFIKANYTKYEYKIPMRDGKRLFTSVYVPKDVAFDSSKTFPILLTRTPYSVSPYGLSEVKANLGPSPLFGKEKYIFAYQDVRGRWMSEGEFVNMRPFKPDKDGKETDENTDTYDTIEWLIKHVAGHNGKVGQWGISYPGFYTAIGMIDAHPSLKAASPQAPVTDWFIGDDFHHNGALFLPHLFNFMVNFGRPRPGPIRKAVEPFDHETPDGYDFFFDLGPLSNAGKVMKTYEVGYWDEISAHPNYDEFWQARNVRPHIKNIKPAVLTVGGWFDAENLFGALETYKQVEASRAGTHNFLVMGPWLHGGWSRGDGDSLGHIPFESKTAEFYREKIEFPFFQAYLKDKEAKDFPQARAWVFETGRNQWRTYDKWPPANLTARSLYLGANGQIADKASTTVENVFDDYVSDPAKPVPFIDQTAIGMTGDYMVGDQRFASRRPDVLVYKGPVLEEDCTVAGPIKVTLHVATSGTDSDWIVKLIDVYPGDFADPNPNPTGVRMGGFQQLVRGDVMRGKYRDGHYSDPIAFKANEPTVVEFTMNDTLHTFRAGHRMMIQVQSSWFPMVDRNPQTFTDIYTAKESDFQKATQKVYRSKEMPSRLEIKVLPAATP